MREAVAVEPPEVQDEADRSAAPGSIRRLGLWSLALALLNLRGHCPHCGSANARPSSATYAGVLARMAPLTAYRCRECKRHFGVPRYARPTPQDQPAPRRSCPRCGAANVASSTRGSAGLLDGFLARQRLRCLACGASFRAAHRGRAFANVILALALLGGIAVAISAVLEVSKSARPAATAGKASKAKR